MLKKLLITLKYGETKVKIYLIGVLVLLVAGLILLIMGISGKSLIFLGTGAVLLIAGLLVMFSFSFVDIDVDLDKKIPKRERKKVETKKEEVEEENKPDYDDLDIDFSALEDDLSDLAIGVGGLSLNQDKKKSKDKEKDGKEDTEKEETKDVENVEALLEKREKEEDYGFDEAINGDEADGEDAVKGQRSEKKKSGNDLFEVKKPTPKEIKARKKMLKVRKDDRRFTPIFVDSWKEARALHTPAFVQDKGKTASIILVEGALRTELVPMSDFLKVTYQRNVEERLAEDFEAIKNDVEVNNIFGELLPSLYQGNAKADSQVMYKNQYVLGGKIAITPRSLRKLLNKYDFEFRIFDSLNIKGKYSDYFKQAYESRLFWTDNVISQNDYQERIRRILQSMVDNKELGNDEFESDLALMVRFNLITTEYADYYKARRKDNIKIKI